VETIKAWTHFTFPGRNKKYSEFEWHWWHFSANDINELEEDKDVIYLFEGKNFNQEKGNFDYLMGCDLNTNNPEVKKELF
jgi:alpha-amylase